MTKSKENPPINICFPDSKEGMDELAKCAATVHASFVIQYVKNLECPSFQKELLLSQLLKEAKAMHPSQW